VTHLILGLGNPGEEYRATRHNAGFRVLDLLARRFGVRLDRRECNCLLALAHLAAPPPVPPPAAAAQAPPEAAAPAASGVHGAGLPAAAVAPAELVAPGASGTSVCTAESGALSATDAAVAAGTPGSPAAGTAADSIPVLLAKPQTFMNRSGFAARCLTESHTLDVSRVLVVYDELNLPLGRMRLRRDGNPAGHRGMESIIENLRTDQVARLRLGIAPAAGPPAGGDALVEFVLSPFSPAEEEAFAPLVERAADACETWLRAGIDTAMNRFNGGG
jgi:peptidyl-tRNA hydrolase, PTH1 family